MSRLAPIAALVWALLVPALASASAGVGPGAHDWAIKSSGQVRFPAQGQDRPTEHRQSTHQYSRNTSGYSLASRAGATPSAGPLTNRSGDLATAAQRARTLNPRSSSFNANDLHHVFGRGGHNLEGVVQTFGSRNAAMEAMQNAVQSQVRSGQISGVFRTGIRIGGQNMTVRGRVIDGTARIGTAFIP